MRVARLSAAVAAVAAPSVAVLLAASVGVTAAATGSISIGDHGADGEVGAGFQRLVVDGTPVTPGRPSDNAPRGAFR